MLAILLALAGTSAFANPSSSTVNFSNGTEGWVGLQGEDGGTKIDNSVGNGTPGLHTDYLYTGVLFWNTTNQNFLGDYTSAKSVSFGIDVNTHSIDSGGFDNAQYPRDFVVELRQNIAPGKWNSVWKTLGVLDSSTGLQHFSASIADTGASLASSGWKGYNPASADLALPDGVTLSSVLSHVDEVIFSTWVPGFSYDPAHFDVTVDNISITSSVPEPEQMAMLLSGLALLGVAARRKKADKCA
ncbi:PEP-CTERM sorting domain-containing protein [Duganella callida]|uniref:PEP-CTERM sorting domain-containing protein n=2 Tax=Duganella callida TaxID=2561932 RepID=A0A4Y9S3S3_9BURK|nr:PEP-CTERM sorting domain-containing protein [Duganella callida]